MVRYPTRAMPALVRLFRRVNDINVFVEDETYTNLYVVYFGRLLEGVAKIGRVFPLGNRRAVIEACQAAAYDHLGPCAYIIDGDFDGHLGIAAPPCRNLYRLRVYCAENLLICERAALQLAFESSSDDSRSTISRSLAFRGWARDTASILGPLFVRYAVSQMLGLGIPTSSFNAMALLEGNSTSQRLSRTKVKQRLQSFRQAIRQRIRAGDMVLLEKQIRGRIGTSYRKKLDSISGKTYLLPLLGFHLRKMTKFRDTDQALRIRLAHHADVDSDPGLRDFLRSIATTAGSNRE